MTKTVHAIPQITPVDVKANKNRVDYTKKIILCRGIQGSGKTTWANEWVGEDPEHRIRYNNDDIRNMLGGHNKNGYWITNREVIVDQVKRAVLINAMDNSYDIVIDNMNLNPREVKLITDLVDKYSYREPGTIAPDVYRAPYKVEFKDFFIPLEECIERDSKRENPITEEVIRKTYEKYKDILESK